MTPFILKNTEIDKFLETDIPHKYSISTKGSLLDSKGTD
jgi:hypothetical protein